MLVARKFTKQSELLDVLRGVAVASGNQGTNGAGTANLADGSGNGGFADVQTGDTVFISGDSQTFTVQSKSDDNNITLDNNITAGHTADAIWRVFRGGIDVADIVIGPIPDPLQSGAGMIIYDKVDFGVPV